ncbi:hypothetical protein ANCDUO_04070 [Ancylostoma duodenale]|uniref:G-protein coupled receptors family 1 profile domain-containing protein n=1 Tax=Ancylostoma duodenale TaxID=51022 RepID=A0A0C2H1Y8_9BILA|nr:hypothetical protein ANCDUO_04070 [Ancylostoma duodenale]
MNLSPRNNVVDSHLLAGLRMYVALTYTAFNIVGFVVNIWVLYVVAPLLFAPAVKVPKSILFFIFALVVGDLTTMIAMLLLIIELVFGTWQFSAMACTSYLVFDSMNKSVALALGAKKHPLLHLCPRCR